MVKENWNPRKKKKKFKGIWPPTIPPLETSLWPRLAFLHVFKLWDSPYLAKSYPIGIPSSIQYCFISHAYLAFNIWVMVVMPGESHFQWFFMPGWSTGWTLLLLLLLLLSFSCLWQFSGAMINKQQRAPKMQKVEQ